MIAKRIPIRNLQKSNFGRLAQYITNSQGKNERVRDIRITHCHSDTADLAALEIESVQALNTRTTLDKTYHLLVSFREGDRPSLEVMHAIEDRLCSVLGYADHQRISAVHEDTDHLHLHIAINKIHPTRHNAIEPYYDHPKLGAACEALEIEYNLAKDNHVTKHTRGAARAQDMEKAAGIETLIGWVKRGCLEGLLVATSWEALHDVLNKNGLQILPRGNGLVITNGTVGAKASSLHRQLSKHALEEKLGPFEPSQQKTRDTEERSPIRQYQIKPMASKVNTTALWEQYQRERMQSRPQQQVAIEQLKERKDQQMEAAKRKARHKRMWIKLLDDKWSKKMSYHSVSQKLLREIKKINETYREERNALYQNTNRLVWHDWLKQQASNGNQEALAVLRHRYEKEARQAQPTKAPTKAMNELKGTAPTNDNIASFNPVVKIDTVTKRGTVHYKLLSSILRDDGHIFRLGDNLPPDALKETLKLAVQRFGPKLEVHGTESFKSAIVQAAAHMIPRIQFADPALEAQRQAAVKTIAAEVRAQNERRDETQREDAAKQYIAERNEKHAKGLPDILKHRRYEPKDAGKFSYGGLRQVGNTMLMLLQTPSETLVMPVDDATTARMQRLKVSTSIQVTEENVIRMGGRSRSLGVSRGR